MTTLILKQDISKNVKNSENSANEISLNNDVTLDGYNIGLEEHDKAVLYHINTNIKPIVIQNNQQIVVPVSIGNNEMWQAVQYEAHMRDKNGKLLVPFIILNRNGIEPNKEYMNKIDPSFPQKSFIVETKYNKRNSYDRFSILNNVIPSRTLYNIQVPDYITINYDVMMITNYMFQMNHLVESFLYANNSYWGDENYKFKVLIENISDSSEFSIGEERYFRNEFSIKLNGYILPKTLQRDLNKDGKYYSKSKFVIKSEVVTKF